MREKRDAAETKEARDAASSMLKVFKHLGESVMIFLFPRCDVLVSWRVATLYMIYKPKKLSL